MCLISEGCPMCFDICPINYIGECLINYIGEVLINYIRGCPINCIGGLSNKSYRRFVQQIYFRRVVQWMLISKIVQ